MATNLFAPSGLTYSLNSPAVPSDVNCDWSLTLTDANNNIRRPQLSDLSPAERTVSPEVFSRSVGAAEGGGVGVGGQGLQRDGGVIAFEAGELAGG